jgi:hypothetical protein
MTKMNDEKGRKHDTEIASDVVVLRTRMSSTTQIEDVDISCLLIQQQLQTNWSVPVVLSRPSDYTTLPHSRVFSAQFDAVYSPVEYLFRAGDLHLKVACTES